MAKEITAGPSNISGDIALLFLYAIPSPRTYDDVDDVEQTIVPTPASGLPEWAENLLSTAEKAALDAGTAAFETQPLRQTAGMTASELATAARALYADARAAALVKYNVKYHAFYGTRIDKE